MYRMRQWSVSHAKSLNLLYQNLEKLLASTLPKISQRPIEKPITFFEKNIKGFLFDCKMCGQCVLNQTGMSCPMNCPKELRNGPCGGVRMDGGCEVKPEMPCVWVEAWRGSKISHADQSILALQDPVDHQLEGTSSWLREAKRHHNELR